MRHFSLNRVKPTLVSTVAIISLQIIGLTASVQAQITDVPASESSYTDAQMRYVVAGSPNDTRYQTNSTPFNGNVSIVAGNYAGSGVLIADNVILTCGHLLNNGASAGQISVNFNTTAGNYSLGATSFLVNPGFKGNVWGGSDLGLIFLNGSAPSAAQRYQIYTGSDEIGQQATMVGYGYSGTGGTGEQDGSYGYGTRRTGHNKYEMTSGDFANRIGATGALADTYLVYGFKDGNPDHDPFHSKFGMAADPGYGADEVNSAPGDSGGAIFINGKVAGITSWGLGNGGWFQLDSDVVSGTNSSYGEFSFDTRVSLYQDWINASIRQTTDTPEPSSAFLLIPGLIAFAMVRKRLPR